MALSLLFGVLKGSVLDPALFTMYTKPLRTIAQRSGVKYHLYADDTQLYVSLDPGNKADVFLFTDQTKESHLHQTTTNSKAISVIFLDDLTV